MKDAIDAKDPHYNYSSLKYIQVLPAKKGANEEEAKALAAKAVEMQESVVKIYAEKLGQDAETWKKRGT